MLGQGRSAAISGDVRCTFSVSVAGARIRVSILTTIGRRSWTLARSIGRPPGRRVGVGFRLNRFSDFA